MSLRLNVNGEDRVSFAEPLTPLVDVLRDEFHLTGAKVVCREGFCGACIVHLDGRPVVSCLMPVGTVEGREVRTVESLAAAGEPSPLQQVIEEHDVVQCGIRERPNAPRDEIKASLVGNICRCTGYERLVDAAVALAERS